MGIRQSAPVKTNNHASTSSHNMVRQVCFNDFKINRYFDPSSSQQYVLNWVVEYKPTSEIMLLKEMNKLEIYDDCKVDDYINYLKLLVKIQSRFLLKPMYAFQDIENLYFVAEFVSGGDLAQILKYHQFSEYQAKVLLAYIIAGLSHIHSHRSVMTNLRPECILIDERGMPKIHGLNNSKNFDEYEIGPSEDVISIYLAPEVLLRQPFGPETDYYSLGIILLEMMTNKKPIEPDMPRAGLIDAIINRQSQVKKSELPEDWSIDAADFINKLIQKISFMRLGYYGLSEIKNHNWFKGIQWDKIEQGNVQTNFAPRNILNSPIQSIKRRRYKQQHPFYRNQNFQNQFADFHYKWELEQPEFTDPSIKYLQT